MTPTESLGSPLRGHTIQMARKISAVLTDMCGPVTSIHRSWCRIIQQVDQTAYGISKVEAPERINIFHDSLGWVEYGNSLCRNPQGKMETTFPSLLVMRGRQGLGPGTQPLSWAWERGQFCPQRLGEFRECLPGEARRLTPFCSGCGPPGTTQLQWPH